MFKVKVEWLAISLALLGVLPAQAHHSGAAVDMTRTVTIAGTVKEWLWANPHCWLYVVASNDLGGTDEWAVEAGPVVGMARKGLRNSSFKPGDKVEVVLSPRKDGKNGGGLLKVTVTATGKVYEVGAQFPIPTAAP